MQACTLSVTCARASFRPYVLEPVRALLRDALRTGLDVVRLGHVEDERVHARRASRLLLQRAHALRREAPGKDGVPARGQAEREHVPEPSVTSLSQAAQPNEARRSQRAFEGTRGH